MSVRVAGRRRGLRALRGRLARLEVDVYACPLASASVLDAPDAVTERTDELRQLLGVRADLRVVAQPEDPIERDAEPWATPKAWAEKRGYGEILKMLEEAGG